MARTWDNRWPTESASTTVLSRNSATPLYKQFGEHLKGQILRGRYRANDRLRLSRSAGGAVLPNDLWFYSGPLSRSDWAFDMGDGTQDQLWTWSTHNPTLHNWMGGASTDIHFSQFIRTPWGNGPEASYIVWNDYGQSWNGGQRFYVRLFKNSNGNANLYLKVKLHGDGVNISREAIGAQVRIDLNGRTLTRQVEAGMGQGNQNELTLHFGVGSYNGPLNL